MNLKKGKIELSGITLKSDTIMDEVINNPKVQFYASNDEHIALLTMEQVIVDGYTFDVDIYFIDKHLDKITLNPIHLEMKDPLYPSEKYQVEKKKVCDLFLRKELGEPTTETESVVFYEYDWGTICSVTFLKGRDAYAGGFIEINYNT